MDKNTTIDNTKINYDEYAINEINNTVKWMETELENCFARNSKRHNCTALEQNYCSNQNMTYCKFYQPATYAIESIIESDKKNAQMYKKHPEYQIISNDTLKQIIRNQNGKTIKKTRLTEIIKKTKEIRLKSKP